jgi:uncharacterized protein (TIGR00299 family) protein
MKIACFDLVCGAAGDMIIASMIDCGLDFDRLKYELKKLSLNNYRLKIEKTKKHHISVSKFTVDIDESHAHQNLNDIRRIIHDSKLDENIKAKCAAIFQRLAEAEAKAHGESIDEVHFHEVGMVDAIIDICGAVIGMELLGIKKIFCSPLTIGNGIIDTQHGRMPVPAPATAELIKGFPVFRTDIQGEILTPTGAAILTTLCDFSEPPPFTIESIGYGAGTNDYKTRPNYLRLFVGSIQPDMDSDEAVILETNLDRTSPEQLGHIMDSLLKAGALDVFIVPILMKKNRPGHLLTVICNPEDELKYCGMIFQSGVTLGIRRKRVKRFKLKREEKIIQTKYGDIPVKLARHDGKLLYFPEFDTVAEIAGRLKLNFDEIYLEIKTGVERSHNG